MTNDPRSGIKDLSDVLLDVWGTTCRRRLAEKTYRPLSDTQRQFYKARLKVVIAERQRRRTR